MRLTRLLEGKAKLNDLFIVSVSKSQSSMLSTVLAEFGVSWQRELLEYFRYRYKLTHSERCDTREILLNAGLFVKPRLSCTLNLLAPGATLIRVFLQLQCHTAKGQALLDVKQQVILTSIL
jgi:hypothetical protein